MKALLFHLADVLPNKRVKALFFHLKPKVIKDKTSSCSPFDRLMINYF